MLKTLLFATLASFALGAAHAAAPDAFAKEAFAATTPMPLLAEPPPDFDPDPDFGNYPPGVRVYPVDYTNSRETQTLRVIERPGKAGWFVLAKHGTGDGVWDAVVILAGPDSYPEPYVLVRTPMFRIDDATWDSANGKFYFVGGAKQPGHADSDFAVTCVDIEAAAACSGFGTNGTAYIAFDRGGSKDDVARRVISRPNLGVLVAGWAKDGADRYVFAATTLYRASGAPVPRFGNNGLFTYDMGSILTNLDVNVYDMALSNAPDQEARLYIAGNYSRNTARNDYDGVILGLNAWTGTLDAWGPGGNGSAQVIVDLGADSGFRNDAVTAIHVLANGKLALAGWAVDGNGWRQMVIGRLRSNGVNDTGPGGFCGGAGYCVPSIVDFQEHSPVAIAERPGNRDLVVATENATHPGQDHEMFEHLFLFSDRGAQRADYIIQTRWTHGYPGIQHRAPVAILVDNDATMITGSWLFPNSTNNYDVSLVRLLANDSIFADTFGGGNAD